MQVLFPERVDCSHDTVQRGYVDSSSKVAVVTGASGPIGAAVAEGFAQAGASVVLVYGRDPAAVQTAKMLSDKNGVQCIAMQLDGRS